MTRIKVNCSYKQIMDHDHGTHVHFSPVYKGSKENEEFFRWTPGGQVSFLIRNQIAEQFEIGKEYYLDITPAE